MIIKFKTLKLHNFMSFGDAEIDLDTDGYTLVNGKNLNPADAAKSNGSGKSSLFDAISYALTGTTIRGSKNVTNIYLDGGAKVELTFSIDDKDWRVTRTKSPANLELYVNDKNVSGKGIRDTEKLLSEYLPDLTGELLGSVIILGQGLPQKLSGNTPSGRKEVLEKLSKSDFMIDDLKQRITSRKTILLQEKRDIEDNILTIRTQQKVHQDTLIQAQHKLDGLKPESFYLTRIEEIKNNVKTLKATQPDKEVLNEQRSQLVNIQADISTTSATFDSSISDLKKSLMSETWALSEAYTKDITPQNNELQQVIADINSLKATIKQYESVTDVCPTCGQRLPDVVKINTSSLRTELSAKVTRQKSLNTELAQCEQSHQNQLKALAEDFAEQERKVLQEKQVKLRDLQVACDELRKATLHMEHALEKSDREVQDLVQEEVEIQIALQSLSTNRAVYEQQIDDTKQALENLDKELLYYDKEATTNKAHLDVIAKMETAIKRDFRGLLLQNVITYIDNKAKEYCKEVFDTDLLNFKQDGNSISISYNSKEYENLSGGEKVRVDIIIQLALRDMLCKYLNFSSNVIVIDEIFDALDGIGCEKVTNLIFKELRDVSAIYIITHRADLPISCDREVFVVKNKDGISSIC